MTDYRIRHQLQFYYPIILIQWTIWSRTSRKPKLALVKRYQSVGTPSMLVLTAMPRKTILQFHKAIISAQRVLHNTGGPSRRRLPSSPFELTQFPPNVQTSFKKCIKTEHVVSTCKCLLYYNVVRYHCSYRTAWPLGTRHFCSLPELSVQLLHYEHMPDS